MKNGNIGLYNFAGVWLKLETDREEFGTLEVLVIPRQINSFFDFGEGDLTACLTAVVVDWNLNDNGKKVECNDANKNRYLAVLSQWGIKNPTYAQAAKGMNTRTVGAEILAFSGDINNFLKN